MRGTRGTAPARVQLVAPRGQAAPGEEPRAHPSPGRAGGPLELNALALMVGTVTTAGVGLVFWAAAAHYYPATEVGRASAVISTATLLGGLAHLNLGHVYARFLPVSGRRIQPLVRRGLTLTTAVGLVVGTGFVLLWPTGALFASGTERVLFPVAVAVLTVFTVQDFILMGLRAATWIPVENLLFSLAKLAMLVGLAGMLPRGGLVTAWVAPAAVAVVVVLVLMHRALIPRQEARADAADTLPPTRALVGYAAGEYATGLMTNLVQMLLPLIIIAQLGAQQNAYFAMPWVMSGGLTTLIWSVAASLVVEAAGDEQRIRSLTRRSLRLAMGVAALGGAIQLLGAPLLLRIFGAAYAEEGTTLLRLMALAAPATVITTVYTSVARLRRQLGRVVVVQAVIGATILAFTLLFIDSMGVRAVGLAYLLAEGMVGTVLAVPLFRALRNPGTPRPRPAAGAPGDLESAMPVVPSTPDRGPLVPGR